MNSFPQNSHKIIAELRTAGTLPSPQGVALAIMEVARNEKSTVDDLVRLIRTDPALAGRLICAANAIRRSTHRPMGAISDAVTVLGIAAVRQLALGFSLISNYRTGPCRSFDYEAFWSGSLLTAIAAPAFSAHLRVAAADELFICGLLSRVGRLAMATAYPAEYSALLEAHPAPPGVSLAEHETAALGISSAELTAGLLSEWGITQHLVQPVLHHEDAGCSHFAEGSRSATLRNVLRLAVYFADLSMATEAARRRMLPELFLQAAQIGMTAESVVEQGDQVVAEWRDWAKLLAVSSHDLKAYAALAEAMPDAAASEGGSLPSAKMRLLVVDDDRKVTAMLRETLGSDYEVQVAHEGRTGIALALKMEPHIIITDWQLPDMEGTDLCRALRDAVIGQGIYMLILTARTGDDETVEAFEAGVDDVVAKPFHPRVLQARLHAARRAWSLREEIRRDRSEIRRFAGELVIASRRLQDHALNDPVTGLPNRRHAMERLQQEWSAGTRGGGTLSCILIGIDRLKQVNDALGYDTGDRVLQEIASRMRGVARKNDVLCRIGGGDFLMICPDTALTPAVQCATRLQDQVAGGSFNCNGCPVEIAISTGVAARGPDMQGPADLIMAADQALEHVRRSGRNRLTGMPAGRMSDKTAAAA